MNNEQRELVICARPFVQRKTFYQSAGSRGAFPIDAPRPPHTHTHTHNNANPISRHFSSVDKFVFKNIFTCVRLGDGQRCARLSFSKIHFSVVRLAMQCVCVCIRRSCSDRAMNDENDADTYELSSLYTEHSWPSAIYKIVAEICLFGFMLVSSIVTTLAHIRTHTSTSTDSGQTTISCLDGT